MKKTTLCYPIHNGRVLLAMKKRGFGAGKWNGAGGKVRGDETVEGACRRETFEETGVMVGALEYRGMITFRFPARPDWDQECHVFVTSDINGEPIETDEMRPAWFAQDCLPFTEMWEDDCYWLEGVLQGGELCAVSIHGEDGSLVHFESGSPSTGPSGLDERIGEPPG